MLMLLVLLLLAGDSDAQLQHNALSYFGRGGVWRYQKTFTRYPSNSKTNVKNRCPELGAGAGIGPVTPASQRKDQDVMLRLLKSMEPIVCQWSSNSFCENSVGV